MKYCVVAEKGYPDYEVYEKLEKEVTKLCNEGWRPQGGVSISNYEVGYQIRISVAQAMVKD